MPKFYLIVSLLISSVILFSQKEETFRVSKKPVEKIQQRTFHRTFFISESTFLLDTSMAVGDTIRMAGSRFPLGKCSFVINENGEVYKAEMFQGVITLSLFIVLSEKLFKNPNAICFVDMQEVKTTKGVIISRGGQYVAKVVR